MKKYSGKRYNPVVAFIGNILLVYVSYFICRVAYVLENWEVFSSTLKENPMTELMCGSLLFDTSAILYTNILYAVMMLLPFHLKEQGGLGRKWYSVAKIVFFVVNSIAVVVNLCDAVYFAYTGRRTTISVLKEFGNESNLSGIFFVEVMRKWYLLLLGVVVIYGLWRLYIAPEVKKEKLWLRKEKMQYYILSGLVFLLYIPLTIAGMRGGFTTAVRPITISNANQYVNTPKEAAAILNTPFSLIRTISQKTFQVPNYFTAEELDKVYSPVHNSSNLESSGSEEKVTTMRKKNVVVLIVESFCKQYIGALNGLDHGYAPFVDELVNKSLTFEYSYCNGRKSIDGMPSILSSIPMFVEPFVLTSASMNDVGGMARILGSEGYETAFFHGAANGSMGFQAFSRSTGFGSYYGRTEYNEDKRFGGDNDFDGTWAIWDEPFMQYYCTKMSEMKEPFMTAVFTASSHHPFAIPEKYKDTYKEEGDNPIHKCIRYTDMALRKFFESASKEKWFENTIFVMTSDHTNGVEAPEYGTDLGLYSVPIIIYDPSGEIKPERSMAIAQQIDIMPTILGYLGYDKPYVAFGKDLLKTSQEDSWAVNYLNGIYQFVKGDYLLQFDGTKTKAVYKFKTDKMLKTNLVGKIGDAQKNMENELKAIMQSYFYRMTENKLIFGR